MSHPRRAYSTAYARRRRHEQLEREQLRSQRCPRAAGVGKCGGILETYIEAGSGRTRVRCPLCERRERGVCRDCDARVEGQVGKAMRCARHKQIQRNKCCARYAEDNHELVLQRGREHYNRPEIRAARNEYKRLWRKANPDKVRAQKRRYIAKHAKDPKSAYNRYHVRYRKKFLHHRREVERDRLVKSPAARKTSPKCTRCGKSTRWRPLPRAHCGRPWSVCTRCLFPSERKIRMRLRRQQLKRSKEWLASIPKPERIKRPPQAPAYGPAKERLCLGGCGRVLTHRKKKCSRCKELAAQSAAERLSRRRGRGRRVDLEAAA